MEIGQLIGNGFYLKNFYDGTNSIIFGDKKWFAVTLTYTGQNQWKSTTMLVHYKSGSYDLYIEDFKGDNSSEP